MLQKFVLLSISLMITAGCASTYVKTGEGHAEPRDSDCDISILTTAPSGSYKEVGLLKFDEPVRPERVDYIFSTDRERVCTNGGNAILYGNMNSEGNFRTATVLIVN